MFKKKNKNAEIKKEVLDIEIKPYKMKNQDDLENYTKFSLDSINDLGSMFKPLFDSLQKMGNKKGKNNLYKAILPNGTHLAKLNEGNSLIKTAIKDGKGIIDQAKLIPAGDVNIPPVNPALLCMAIALMNIDKKLDLIYKNGKELIEFFEEKEKANLDGNLKILTDIFNNYKFNVNNQLFKTNKHIQVQEIKADAEKSISLYQSIIKSELKKQSLMHDSKDVNEKIKKIEKNFNNYQFALYIYSFSYLIEIILLENFEKIYLESVSNTIETHYEEYKTLYSELYEFIENYSNTSLKNQTVQSLSNITKGTGNVISKIPLINKTQLDKKLINVSENLEKKREQNTSVIMENIFSKDNELIKPFIENINMVNKLYNNSTDILIDGEKIYIKN